MTTKQREVLADALVSCGIGDVYSGWEHLSGSCKGSQWLVRFMNEHGDILEVDDRGRVEYITARRTQASLDRLAGSTRRLTTKQAVFVAAIAGGRTVDEALEVAEVSTYGSNRADFVLRLIRSGHLRLSAN